MRTTPRKVAAFFLITFLILAKSDSSFAQSKREVDPVPTTSGCFRIKVDPIRVAPPPVKKDMSQTTISGYHYFDSLCKREKNYESIDSMITSIALNNGLARFEKYIYAMEAYDPIMFHEYGAYAIDVDSSYKSSPSPIIWAFQKAFKKSLGYQSPKIMLLTSSVIAQIKVVEVYRDSDVNASVPVHPLPIVCVTAEVKEIIKGKHLPHIGYPDISGDCLQIDFSPLWEKKRNRGDIVDDFCENCYDTNSVSVGREYIVFCHYLILDYDGTFAYYAMWPSSFYENTGGLFPIDTVTGEVNDVDNFWGMGKKVPKEKFIIGIRSKIGELMR